jgi:hypothetical protein
MLGASANMPGRVLITIAATAFGLAALHLIHEYLRFGRHFIYPNILLTFMQPEVHQRPSFRNLAAPAHHGRHGPGGELRGGLCARSGCHCGR